MDVNWTYCADHFAIYTNTESLYYIPEMNKMLYTLLYYIVIIHYIKYYFNYFIILTLPYI